MTFQKFDGGRYIVLAFSYEIKVYPIDGTEERLMTDSQLSGVTYQSPLSWDEFFMSMAFLWAKRSKDPSTKAGCVLVSPDNRMTRGGYNGFVSGGPDTKENWDRRTSEKPGELTKYDRVIHAEMNAIINAKCDLDGWTAYITHPPCKECAKNLTQTGVARVLYGRPYGEMKMDVHREIVEQLFQEAGIEFAHFPMKEQYVI